MQKGLFLGNVNDNRCPSFEEYTAIFGFVSKYCVATPGESRRVLHLDNNKILIMYESGDLWLTEE